MIIDYEELYLVPITAVEGYAGPEECFEDSRQIVAAPQEYIKDKNTFLWSSEDVTSQVDPAPIANWCLIYCYSYMIIWLIDW